MVNFVNYISGVLMGVKQLTEKGLEKHSDSDEELRQLLVLWSFQQKFCSSLNFGRSCLCSAV